MLTQQLTASIVIHNSPRLQVVRALLCLLITPVNTIYLIDNGDDTSLAFLAGYSPRIRYIHVENRGFGAGHNNALKEILKDPDGFHLVMNADVCWDGDILTPLVSYLENNQDVGMVMPKVMYPDGDLQYTCRMLPTPFDLFLKRFLPAKITRKRMERYLLASHDHDKPLNCPYLLGSFLLFRNKALKDCGIFDERFFMYPEDIDITRRIHEKWKTMYHPAVTIIHEHAAASRHSGKMLRIHLTNMVKYFNKWGWLFDKQRRQFNRQLLNSITPIPPEQRPPGRG
ncbi:MAG: glycosyltransferase [Muribaculaceae bacterium]|nr:glycosyltransferase [Muribaculaceae bacterium]